MNIDVYGLSDVGMRRERNEDNYLINPDLGLYVVADGMGGHVGGAYASRLAVETIEHIARQIMGEGGPAWLTENNLRADDYASQLKFAIQTASNNIYREAKNDKAFRGMGTTTVVLLIRNFRVYIANVGDSRSYLIRDRQITQLTQDHSLVGEQIRAGVIPKGAAKGHRLKNIITRSVGFQEEVDIDVITKVPNEGDRFMLCSDGLTNMIEDSEILSVVSENSTKEACHVLVDMANARGGDDNITVILSEFTDVGSFKGVIGPDDESTIGI